MGRAVAASGAAVAGARQEAVAEAGAEGSATGRIVVLPPRSVRRDLASAAGFWCMGFWQRFRHPALRLGHRDGELPWCKGFCLGPHQRAVLRPAQSVGREGWRHQHRRHAVQPGGEVGRQPVAAAHRREQHLPAAEHGQHVAFVGAGLGHCSAVDGAGGAQASEALRGARAGAPPAMHAAAELAPDGRRAAGAAGAGARATARRKREVGVAAALFRRRRARARSGWLRGGMGRDCDDAGGTWKGRSWPYVFAGMFLNTPDPA